MISVKNVLADVIHREDCAHVVGECTNVSAFFFDGIQVVISTVKQNVLLLVLVNHAMASAVDEQESFLTLPTKRSELVLDVANGQIDFTNRPVFNVDYILILDTKSMRSMHCYYCIFFCVCQVIPLRRPLRINHPGKRVVLLMEDEGFLHNEIYAFMKLNQVNVLMD